MTKVCVGFAAGVVFGLVAAAASGTGSAGQMADAATREALAAVKSQVVQAYKDRDAAALERLYGDDYTAVDADGSIRTKADELARVRRDAGDRVVEGRYDLIAVRRFGNVAVASGRGDLTYKAADGSTRKAVYNSVNVFELRGGRWEYAAAYLP